MEETSMLLKIFDKEKWHNIPKCMVETIEAIIDECEHNRLTIIENYKKSLSGFSTVDTKLMKMEQKMWGITDNVKSLTAAAQTELNTKMELA